MRRTHIGTYYVYRFVFAANNIGTVYVHTYVGADVLKKYRNNTYRRRHFRCLSTYLLTVVDNKPYQSINIRFTE